MPMPQRIDSLHGLVEFVAAAEAGSFSAAARLLGVSVAHISRRVRDLEARIGVQLIHRTTRESVLTEAGRDFFDQGRALLDGLDEMRERIQSGQSTVRGQIRISMGGFFAETRIGPLLSRFAFDHPEVRLTVDLNSHNVSLTGEGFDLAIRAGPLEPSGLIGRRLTGFRFLTLGSPALLGRVGVPARPENLDPALCLPLGGRDWAFNRGKQRQTLRPTGRYSANSGALLIGAAVIGAGFVQVPAYYGLAELASGALVPLLDAWTDDDEGFEFHIVYPPQRHLPMRIRTLIDFLVGEIK